MYLCTHAGACYRKITKNMTPFPGNSNSVISCEYPFNSLRFGHTKEFSTTQNLIQFSLVTIPLIQVQSVTLKSFLTQKNLIRFSLVTIPLIQVQSVTLKSFPTTQQRCTGTPSSHLPRSTSPSSVSLQTSGKTTEYVPIQSGQDNNIGANGVS